MKKYLLPTIFLALASVAFAGSNCCEKGGEKTDKDKSASKHVETSVIVAGDCADKCDKKKDKSAFESTAQFAGSGCGDKCSGDKTEKSGKTGLSNSSFEFAGDACSGDKEGKKCGGKKHLISSATYA
jgi:hypothetical protein